MSKCSLKIDPLHFHSPVGNSWIPRMHNQDLLLMLRVVLNEAVTPPINPEQLAADIHILAIFFLLCCNSLGSRKPRCPSWCSLVNLAPGVVAHMGHKGWALSVCPNPGVLPFQVRQNQSSAHQWSSPFPSCPAAWGGFDLSLCAAAEGGDCCAQGKNLRQTWMCWVKKKKIKKRNRWKQ